MQNCRFENNTQLCSDNIEKSRIHNSLCHMHLQENKFNFNDCKKQQLNCLQIIMSEKLPGNITLSVHLTAKI